MTVRHRCPGIVLLVAFGLVAASCSDADTDTDATAPTPSESPTTTTEGPTTTTAPSTSTTTTTTSTTTTSITSTAPPERPTITVAPGDIVTVDMGDVDAPSGTALFLVEPATGLPAWHQVGAVGDDPTRTEITIPGFVMYRLTAGDFGEAEFEQLRAGTYDLIAAGRPPSLTVTVSSDGDVTGFIEDFEDPRPAVDPDNAILTDSGLAGVAFETPTVDALATLVGRFGEPSDDQVVDACLVRRIVAWDNGIHARFDLDTDTFVEYSFHAWDEPVVWSADTEIPWPPVTVERPPFTTPDGARLGMTRGEQFPWWDHSGGYDGSWGASIWFESDTLGGRMSGDVSDPSSTVISIEAGQEGNPARVVC